MSAPAQPHPWLATDPAAPLAERVRAAGIREVECVFPDISGVPRGKFMPAESFARGAELRIAQAIPMQCVTGEYSLDTTLFADSDPDVRLVPDAATLRPVPWASPQRPRLLALHDCLEPDGSPCDYAVRNLLKGVHYDSRGATTQSLVRIVSSSCSTTMMVLPTSQRLRSVFTN